MKKITVIDEDNEVVKRIVRAKLLEMVSEYVLYMMEWEFGKRGNVSRKRIACLQSVLFKINEETWQENIKIYVRWNTLTKIL